MTERLRGFVQKFVKGENYGFIVVPGHRRSTAEPLKQWHFHRQSLRAGTPQKSIAKGVVVEFTPVPSPAVGKCDKATDVEVVG